jgi:predicted nucleotidyltransferase
MVYMDESGLLERARCLSDSHTNRAALRLAYRKLAQQDLTHQILQRGAVKHGAERSVVRKKYVHVLRSVLSAAWLRKDPSDAASETPAEQRRWPPLRLDELAHSTALPPAVRTAIDALIAPATRHALPLRGEPLPELEHFASHALREATEEDVASPGASHGAAAGVAQPGAEPARAAWDEFCIGAYKELFEINARSVSFA